MVNMIPLPLPIRDMHYDPSNCAFMHLSTLKHAVDAQLDAYTQFLGGCFLVFSLLLAYNLKAFCHQCPLSLSGCVCLLLSIILNQLGISCNLLEPGAKCCYHCGY